MKKINYALTGILILLLVVLASLMLLINIKTEQLTGQAIEQNNPQTQEQEIQTQVLKWNHMPITYNYNEQCANYYNGKYPEEIKAALDYITLKTDGKIQFTKTNGTADINYICQIDNNNFVKLSNNSTYTSAEAKLEINRLDNEYVKGNVYIYSTKHCLGQKPVVLIHETLHLFGLEHSEQFEFGSGQSKDIMAEANTNCYADITDEDANKLIEIYS